MLKVSPSDSFRAFIYATMAFVYLNETSEDVKKSNLSAISIAILPKELRLYMNEHKNVILFYGYLLLAYYYFFLDRE